MAMKRVLVRPGLGPIGARVAAAPGRPEPLADSRVG
jgi:hypothetical protein